MRATSLILAVIFLSCSVVKLFDANCSSAKAITSPADFNQLEIPSLSPNLKYSLLNASEYPPEEIKPNQC